MRRTIEDAIQSGYEPHLRLASMAINSIRAAKDAAAILGLSQEEAAAFAAKAVVDAAPDLQESRRAQVRKAALDALIDYAHDNDGASENRADRKRQRAFLEYCWLRRGLELTYLPAN